MFSGMGELSIATPQGMRSLGRLRDIEISIDPASGPDLAASIAAIRTRPVFSGILGDGDPSIREPERIQAPPHTQLTARALSEAMRDFRHRMGSLDLSSFSGIQTGTVTGRTSSRDLVQASRREMHPYAMVFADSMYFDTESGPALPEIPEPVVDSADVQRKVEEAIQYASEAEGWSMRKDAKRLQKQRIAPSPREVRQMAAGVCQALLEAGTHTSYSLEASFNGYGTTRRLITTVLIYGARRSRKAVGMRLVGISAVTVGDSFEQIDAGLLEEARRARFASHSVVERGRRFGQRGRA